MKTCFKILEDGSLCGRKHHAKELCLTHYNYYIQENSTDEPV